MDLPEDFIQKLDDYFNENYVNQINELRVSIENYTRLMARLETPLMEMMSKSQHTYLDIKLISQQYELIQSKYEHNMDLFKQKQSQPSKPVEPAFLKPFVEVQRANEEIKKHNDIVQNRENEVHILISQI